MNISKKELVREHSRLVKLLKKYSSHKDIKMEYLRQCKELKKYRR